MERFIVTKKGKVIDTTNKCLNFVSKEEFEKQRALNEEGTIVSYIENDIWYCFCEEDGSVTWEEPIIAKSDFRMGLCNIFVLVDYYKNKPLPFEDMFSLDKFLYDRHQSPEDYDIRGGVFTEDGMAYVCKLVGKEWMEI